MVRGLTPASRASLSAVVHGRHPMRGYPVTWHITPQPGGAGGRVTFLVEQADGEIDDADAWEYASKQARLMSVAEARDLVERATGHVAGTERVP